MAARTELNVSSRCTSLYIKACAIRLGAEPVEHSHDRTSTRMRDTKVYVRLSSRGRNRKLRGDTELPGEGDHDNENPLRSLQIASRRSISPRVVEPHQF